MISSLALETILLLTQSIDSLARASYTWLLVSCNLEAPKSFSLELLLKQESFLLSLLIIWKLSKWVYIYSCYSLIY